MPVHVAGLFAKVFLTERDGLIQVAALAVLIGEGRKEAPRVFLVSFLEFVEPGRSQDDRPRGMEEDSPRKRTASIRSSDVS
ncbi:MAG: hypothetical protein P3A28_00525 [Gemmatimonadota bacterium]|nr:hypothetical protein [Gemmatimonadota bacterium]